MASNDKKVVHKCQKILPYAFVGKKEFFDILRDAILPKIIDDLKIIFF